MLYSLLLLLSSLFAFTAPNLNRPLRLYFGSEVGVILVTEACLHLTHWQSSTYVAVYAFGSLINRFFGWIVLESLGWHPWERLIAGGFAIGLAGVAATHQDEVLGLESAVLLPEAALLLFLGTAVGFRAPFSQHRNVLVPLAIVWLGLGAFDLGILMHHTQVWQSIMDVAGYFIVIVGFSWVGFTSRLRPSRSS